MGECFSRVHHSLKHLTVLTVSSTHLHFVLQFSNSPALKIAVRPDEWHLCFIDVRGTSKSDPSVMVVNTIHRKL